MGRGGLGRSGLQGTPLAPPPPRRHPKRESQRGRRGGGGSFRTRGRAWGRGRACWGCSGLRRQRGGRCMSAGVRGSLGWGHPRWGSLLLSPSPAPGLRDPAARSYERAALRSDLGAPSRGSFGDWGGLTRLGRCWKLGAGCFKMMQEAGTWRFLKASVGAARAACAMGSPAPHNLHTQLSLGHPTVQAPLCPPGMRVTLSLQPQAWPCAWP